MLCAGKFCKLFYWARRWGSFITDAAEGGQQGSDQGPRAQAAHPAGASQGRPHPQGAPGELEEPSQHQAAVTEWQIHQETVRPAVRVLYFKILFHFLFVVTSFY